MRLNKSMVLKNCWFGGNRQVEVNFDEYGYCIFFTFWYDDCLQRLEPKRRQDLNHHLGDHAREDTEKSPEHATAQFQPIHS